MFIKLNMQHVITRWHTIVVYRYCQINIQFHSGILFVYMHHHVKDVLYTMGLGTKRTFTNTNLPTEHINIKSRA